MKQPCQSIFQILRLHLDLMKIPLSLMVGMSSVFGFILENNHSLFSIFMTGGGVFLLACGAGALNNYQDRNVDCFLSRTKNRPIPAGLLPPGRALILSLFLILSGISILYIFNQTLIAPGLGCLALLLYNGIYTPLKSRFFPGFLAGIFCGMLPPLIGWVAAGGDMLSIRIWTIMVIFGFWQFPHFWLIYLCHASDYKHSSVANSIKSLSARQLEKVMFIWVLNFSIMLMAIPFSYMNAAYAAGYAIAASAISLTIFTARNIFATTGRQNYHQIYHYLNATIAFAMAIVIFDRLIGA